MKRAGTLIRSPMEGRRDKDKSDGNLKAAEVYIPTSSLIMR